MTVYTSPLTPTREGFVDAAVANLARWRTGEKDLDFVKEARLLLERAEELGEEPLA